MTASPEPVLSTCGLARVALEDHGDFSIATLAGEVDISNAEEVSRVLTDLRNAASGLIVDLGGVDYLDSTAVSLLHELAQRLHVRSQMLIVVCPPQAPSRRVLELTALHTVVPVLDARAPAVETLRTGMAGGADRGDRR